MKAAAGGLGMTIAQETARAVDWATAPKTDEEAPNSKIGGFWSSYLIYV